MMNTIKTQKLSWIDIKNPDKKDIAYLKENFSFHSLTLEEVISPTLRPRVEHFDNYLYLVIHFPLYNLRKQTTESREIDFLITRDTLITIRYAEFPSFKEFWEKYQIDDMAKERSFGESPAYLLYSILENLYTFSLRQIDHITKKINHLEDAMFEEMGSEKMVEKISLARRDIFDFRRAIEPQTTIFDELKIKGIEFFGKEMEPYFVNMVSTYMRVWNLLENHKETIESLRETNDSLVSNRTSRIMKILTVFTVIIFPLTLLANVLGRGATSLPLANYEYGFWIIFAIMFIATLGVLIFFKWKKWF